MAKLTERVAIANGDISDDDLIHIVHDAGGTPISYKMTVGQLKTFISAITGSGVDNQIAVYNGTDTIEGDASLTWDGNTIRVTGDASNKAQLTLDSDSTQNAVINLNTNGGASNSVIQFQVSDLTKYMVGINGEDDDATNQMLIITNGDSFDDDGVIVMKPNGNVGVGLGNSGEPSANLLEIGASDTTNASLKIREQSGTPTTPESGQLRNDAGAPMWYDGTAWADLSFGSSNQNQATGQIGGSISSVLTPTGTTQTLDWNDGNYQILDLESASGDVTLTLSNPVVGFSYFIEIRQDSTTSLDVIFPSTVKFAGQNAPYTLDVTDSANAVDSVALTWNGTSYLATFAQNHG
jgi:hypothetical protein